jgi:hypothetical protein
MMNNIKFDFDDILIEPYMTTKMNSRKLIDAYTDINTKNRRGFVCFLVDYGSNLNK